MGVVNGYKKIGQAAILLGLNIKSAATIVPLTIVQTDVEDQEFHVENFLQVFIYPKA